MFSGLEKVKIKRENLKRETRVLGLYNILDRYSRYLRTVTAQFAQVLVGKLEKELIVA